MATEVRHRRGTSAQLAAAVPAQSELIHNVETNRLHVGDGSTAGGHALATLADVESRNIDTLGDVSSTNVPAHVIYLQTAGYFSVGDGGGGLYKRVTYEPSHAGKVQSQDGSWWELVPVNVINVICFGVDVSGATDSLAQINAAVTYASIKGVKLFVPDGTINLSADVTAPGNIEWFFGPSVVVTGAGKFPAYGGSNAGYRRPNETRNAIVVGSRDTPVSDVKSGISSTLYSSAGPSFGPKAAVVGYTEKHTTVNDAGAVGGFFEADDMVGWTNSGEGSNNFVEGVRAHGMVTDTAPNGSAYGVVAAALSGTATPKYLVGVESDNRKNGGAHAPAPNGLNTASMSVGFLASCAGTYRSDAAFMVNPYNAQKFATGLHIPAGTCQDRAVYINSDTSVAIEIAGSPTYASMFLPNSAPIRGNNSTNTTQFYLIGVTPENSIRIGQTDAASLILAIPGLGERIVSYGEPDSAGPGFRTLRIAN